MFIHEASEIRLSALIEPLRNPIRTIRGCNIRLDVLTATRFNCKVSGEPCGQCW